MTESAHGDEMTKGFSDDFSHLIVPSDEATSSVVAKGMVVVDTNVLLDLYRFTSNARQELLDALGKLGDRLWIPHQVAYEFHKNRIGAITDHGAAYVNATKALEDARRRLIEALVQLGSRVALPEEEVDRLKSSVDSGINGAIESVRDLRAEHGIPDDALKRDEILKRLQHLFEGKVGDAFTAQEQDDAKKEAQRRIDQEIPPGYKDKNKSDPYGDYILWRQSLVEAKSRNVPLLIVTQDVKEDWFWRIENRTVAARSELVRECQDFAGVPLVIMSTKSFLYRARSQISASVSDSTLSQAGHVPDVATVLMPDGRSGSRGRGVPLTGSSLAEMAEIARSFADTLQRRAERAYMEMHILESAQVQQGHLFPQEGLSEIQELTEERNRALSDIEILREAASQLDAMTKRGAGSIVKFTPILRRGLRMMSGAGKLEHLADEY